MSRTGIATVLTVLGCLLAGPAVAAYSLDHQIGDRDRYVESVTPIADNPAVRGELADRVSQSIITRLMPGGLQLPESARDLVRSGVAKLVETDEFRTGWVAANRAAQPEVVALLRGDPSSLRIVDDTVLLDLGVVADRAKDRLAEQGVPFTERLPDIDASVRLFSRPAIRQAIPAFGVLQDLSAVLPIIAAALVIAGFAVSARRVRALVVTGLGLAVSMLLVVLYQGIGRDRLIARSQSPDLAGAFYDAFTGDLTALVWVFFGLGLLIAFGGLAVPLARRAATRT